MGRKQDYDANELQKMRGTILRLSSSTFAGSAMFFQLNFMCLQFTWPLNQRMSPLAKKQKDLLIIMKSEPTDTAWMLKFPSPGGTF